MLGKLPLPENPTIFIRHQCQIHQIELISLDELAVYQLPILPNILRDPLDRILICQALQKQLTILTSDEMITQYQVDTIW